jgi:hypothetical protein
MTSRGDLIPRQIDCRGLLVRLRGLTPPAMTFSPSSLECVTIARRLMMLIFRALVTDFPTLKAWVTSVQTHRKRWGTSAVDSADELLNFRDAALQDQIAVEWLTLCDLPADWREHQPLDLGQIIALTERPTELHISDLG